MTNRTMLSTDTLPDLQAVLDRLGVGQSLYLSHADCDRLFGVNDALIGRVRNFARGHGCSVVWDEVGLIFRRLLQPGDARAAVPACGEPNG